MSRTGIVPSARRTADLPATTDGADRLRVKLSACAEALEGASASRPTAAASANLVFIRAAKLRRRPQSPLNRTSMDAPGEHHRRLDLARRNVPVVAQQLRGALLPDVLEAVPLVERNRPPCRRPCAHQDRTGGELEQVLQEGAADATSL